MNILDKIKAYKEQEIAKRKSLCPIKDLENSAHFVAKTISLKEHLNGKNRSGIIA